MILTDKQFYIAVYILIPSFWILCIIIFIQASNIIGLKKKLKGYTDPKSKIVVFKTSKPIINN